MNARDCGCQHSDSTTIRPSFYSTRLWRFLGYGNAGIGVCCCCRSNCNAGIFDSLTLGLVWPARALAIYMPRMSMNILGRAFICIDHDPNQLLAQHPNATRPILSEWRDHAWFRRQLGRLCACGFAMLWLGSVPPPHSHPLGAAHRRIPRLAREERSSRGRIIRITAGRHKDPLHCGTYHENWPKDLRHPGVRRLHQESYRAGTRTRQVQVLPHHAQLWRGARLHRPLRLQELPLQEARSVRQAERVP